MDLLSLAYLGIAAFASMNANYPCREALRIVRESPRPAFVVLWGTFGKEKSCIERYLKQNRRREHLLQIHLTNEAGRRNSRLRSGELYPRASVRRYNRLLEKGRANRTYARIRRITRFVETVKREKTKLVLSLGLEDNFTKRARVKLLEKAQEIWPYSLAFNPVGDNCMGVPSGARCESHSLRPRFKGHPCSWSNDGKDILEIDLREQLERVKNCDIIYLWDAGSQGIKNGFIDPKKREFKFDARAKRELKRGVRHGILG